MSNIQEPDHYLVVSNMRSGSSAVSRVMHEQMDITMFMHPPEPDEFNPGGYYEDVEVTNTNELAIRGDITVFDHIRLIDKYKTHMVMREEPWGLKDGRIALLAPVYKLFLPNARIIRLYRKAEDVIKSMMKKYKWDFEKARVREFITNVYIDAVWGDNIWASLNMTKKRTDSEIKNVISNRIKEI